MLYFRSADIFPSEYLPVEQGQLLRRILRKAFRLTSKPYPAGEKREFRTMVQYCWDCHSLLPCHEFSFDDLAPLYADYRSQTYNKERSAVEPYYARICDLVGNDAVEIANRNVAAAAFLNKNKSYFSAGNVLDFGGSDGRFIPAPILNFFQSVDIYDVSNAPVHFSVPADKVRKTSSPPEGGYAFLLCMHVLEHVGNPRAQVAEMLKYLPAGGLIYIEIPLELSEEMKRQFSSSEIDAVFHIHEHINQFERLSLVKLAESMEGIKLLDCADDMVDVVWANMKIGRCLLQKTK
jgi:2-polyprenyl-3-methyl-5-hydroxy-6-metoxy-1,4-benzoquinol methylase